jgi:L-ribulose-5-phosphate 4-epimerase
MKETGVIKFNCKWVKSAALPYSTIAELNDWRNKMFALGFIGLNEDKIGYGNISFRLSDKEFIISGSATGNLEKLSNENYTKVVAYNFENNAVTCSGPCLASSESLTHAALYECDKNINAVIHIHHNTLWNKLLNQIPTTSAAVEYGTPAMALEVKRLYRESNLKSNKILAMAGHQDGIIAFGENLKEAGNLLLQA